VLVAAAAVLLIQAVALVVLAVEALVEVIA
jgi:hypothetical protein